MTAFNLQVFGLTRERLKVILSYVAKGRKELAARRDVGAIPRPEAGR
jgi:hypothetical protein